MADKENSDEIPVEVISEEEENSTGTNLPVEELENLLEIEKQKVADFDRLRPQTTTPPSKG